MPRKKLIRTASLPYHIWARSNNRDWFYIPQDAMWEVCLDHLFKVTIAYGLRVHAFTLMHNHFHLVASTAFANLGDVMNYFMREVSREVNRRANRVNHIFGGSYKASLIDDISYYCNVIRYVYQNPIRAGICSSVDGYMFTTLSVIFGQTQTPLPIYPSIFDYKNPLLNNTDPALLWINKVPNQIIMNAIRGGLHKTVFRLPPDKVTRKEMRFPEEDQAEIDAILNEK
jgi:putative transposase